MRRRHRDSNVVVLAILKTILVDFHVHELLLMSFTRGYYLNKEALYIAINVVLLNSSSVSF